MSALTEDEILQELWAEKREIIAGGIETHGGRGSLNLSPEMKAARVPIYAALDDVNRRIAARISEVLAADEEEEALP